MLRKFFSLILLTVAVVTSAATGWHTDTELGSPFEALTIKLPDDYTGSERCTVVRLLSPAARETRRGVLYVHGFNDYFFQSAMAKEFAGHGYDFYAVDLHRYGRSLLPGQIRCDVRSLDQYFPDIDSALCVMRRAGVEHIVLMGHSTGGLITSYYLSRNPDAPVEALLLNSPFLDWNMGRLEPFIPLVSALGAVFPGIKISSGSGDAYGCSLRADCHGEWTYNEELKSDPSPRVTLGWVRAINSAQQYLRHHRSIHVPVLLMYSAGSYKGTDWTPEASRADAVLDVADIARYGRTLAPHVYFLRVHGGLHDLSLSAPAVRRSWEAAMFRWLGKLYPETTVNHK